MKLIVQFENKELRYESQAGSKVKDLKKKVQADTGHPVLDQTFYFQGKILRNNDTLYSCRLSDGYKLILKVRSKNVIKNIDKPELKPIIKTVEEVEENMFSFIQNEEVLAISPISGALEQGTFIKYENSDHEKEHGNLPSKFGWINFTETAMESKIIQDDIYKKAIKYLTHQDMKIGQEFFLSCKLFSGYPTEKIYRAELLNKIGEGSELKLIIKFKLFGTTTMTNCQVDGLVGPFFQTDKSDDLRIDMYEDSDLMKEKYLSFLVTVTSCEKCNDIPGFCKSCGCQVCSSNMDEDKLICCDECQEFYHLYCLEPQLVRVPDDDWYCYRCKNDHDHFCKLSKVSKSIKKTRGYKTERKFGGGSSTAKVEKCRLVGPLHAGKIPGILCGHSWPSRNDVSSSGVHRPPIAGIQGNIKGSFSICISDGYEDDEDNGYNFVYSGSGGRDLQDGKKRTNVQSKDQKLTLRNLALAKTMYGCKVDTENGEKTDNYKLSSPVRVVRSYKTHPKYAPKQGFRYDGLYKLSEYYKEIGKSGLIIWKYKFIRDDEEPAPWTLEGIKYIEENGLNYTIKEGKVIYGKSKPYFLPLEIKSAILEDEPNAKPWSSVLTAANDGIKAFYRSFLEEFSCPICSDLIKHPVTTSCKHSFCVACLEKSIKACDNYLFCCPNCRGNIDGTLPPINKKLSAIFGLLLNP